MIARAAEGHGDLLLIDTSEPAGIQAAIDEAMAFARRREFTILKTLGRASEQAYPFGVVMELFDDVWVTRPQLFVGQGAAFGAIITGESARQSTDPAALFPAIRSLMWVVRGLTSAQDDGGPAAPVLMVVSELHNVDSQSLRCLAYLAGRIAELPVTLVLAGRLDTVTSDPEAFASLQAVSSGGSDDRGLQQAAAGPPLSPAAARVLPDADAAVGEKATSQDTGEMLHSAVRASIGGQTRDEVRLLAHRALSEERYEESSHHRPWLTAQLVRALLSVDELELGLEILDGSDRASNQADDHAGDAARAECRAWTLFHQGRLVAALAGGESALLEPDLPSDTAHSLAALVAACHVHAGRFDEAEGILQLLDSSSRLSPRALPLLLETRAQLRLGQRRPADALRDALEARRRGSSIDVASIGPSSWRCLTARAQISFGEVDKAKILAEQELSLARTRDVPRHIISALRVLAMTSAGTRQVTLLSEAVRLGEKHPPRLEYVYALVDLGSALRRTNQRSEARSVLALAFGFADQLGAESAAARAREELAASAGRRAQPDDGESRGLTPSEWRVANVAATGATTREIASELFITPKTVEFHLRHIYQKLEIPSSRDELIRTLDRTDKARRIPPPNAHPAPVDAGDIHNARR